MSYTASYYHIVFGTYRRERTLNLEIKDEMRRYIGGIVRNYKSNLLCANYMPDHVHLLIDLSVETPLSKLVGTIKQSTSLWLKSTNKCPNFIKWSKEYYAISLSPTHKNMVEKYIQGQELHHSACSFEEELDQLVAKLSMSRYPDSFYN